MKQIPAVIANVVLLFSFTAIRAQSVARVHPVSGDVAAADPNAQAISALKCLETRVIVYRSLADFQESGKLARVSLQTFLAELSEVTREVEPVIKQMSDVKLKVKLTNALDAFHDGAYWWEQVDQPRVVNVSALAATDVNRSSTETAFLSTVPYTVAINWRQAHTYLTQAEMLTK
ncbi:MAG: hypothetical protein ABR607_05770 [Pyrinomonadaceae bacterium]